MRKLNHPVVDDVANLSALRKSRSAKARAVRSRIWRIERRYDVYQQHQGNPWHVSPVPTFQNVRDALHDLYSTPPTALAFIKSLRKSIGGACPVCGRDALGTLDHYLPKADYAEFSFYSRNLVPACNRCNNARRNLVRGTNHNERPVHPYFDDFATQRVMTVRFAPDWRAPKLTPIPFNVAGDALVIVQWHIDNVVRPAGIDDYLVDLWGSVVAAPRDFFDDGNSRAAMAASLDKLMRIETTVGKSPNSWRSCFYHGLMSNGDALDYLATLI